MKKLLILFAITLLWGCESTDKTEINLIPLPTDITLHSGKYTLKQETVLSYTDSQLKDAAAYFQEVIRQETGISLRISSENTSTHSIYLSLRDHNDLKDGYLLDISNDGIKLAGNNTRSVILGIQTIRQLLMTANINGDIATLPLLSINDEPAWEWRGMHLDVSRHFFDKNEVKKFIDRMALYKFNKFHWHLTDDQGWRVEIKKYPLLTEKGGWRAYNNHDKECLRLAEKQSNTDYLLPEDKKRIVNGEEEYGGFYTQDDIREVVAYAAQRGIDVIPEIYAGTFYSRYCCISAIIVFQ